MLDLIDSLPPQVRGAVLEAAKALSEAALEVAVEGGLTGVHSLLAGGERREVTRAFAAAITVTLRDHPELEEIGFAGWLARTPARDAFLEVLARPALEPDPVALSRLLEDSEFDPATFPIGLPLLVETLRDSFLVALYANPKTRSFFDAIVQQEQVETARLILRYQRLTHAMVEEIHSAVMSPHTPVVAKRRVPFSAPTLPPGFVERPVVFEEVRAALLAARGGCVAIGTALQGAGGFGKTTLAAALCHDGTVREAFEDGILWVELGETPQLHVKLAELYSALTGERPSFVSADDACAAVAEALEARRCLLVVDDIWRPEHLRCFLRGGPRCVRLITTRHLHVVGDAMLVRVDEMTATEAERMLLAKLPHASGHRVALHRLAERLGEWPLLLELTGSTLRSLGRQGDTLEGALAFVEEQLSRRGPTAFDLRNTADRTLAVALTVDLSLKQLDGEERRRLLELSIFPEETAIPVSTIALLWGSTHSEARALLHQYDDLSLLRHDADAGTVRLHDVMRAYYAENLAREEDLAAVHGRLLDAWSRMCPPDDPASPSASETLAQGRNVAWWRLPEEEMYAWRNLATHLGRARRAEELLHLLLDWRWLEAKLRVAGVPAALADFVALPGDVDLSLVASALRLSGHVLASDPAQLRSQLIGRLLGVDRPKIEAIHRTVATGRSESWLRPVRSGLTRPGALLRTLTGHTDSVQTVAVTPDGRRAFSCSGDGSLRVWDLERGTEERTLADVSGVASAMAVTPDGHRAISSSSDGTLKVWDLERGEEERTLAGHRRGVYAVAVTPDGCRAVSGSTDGMLKVWDLERGVEERTLSGHADWVVAVAVTPDGRRAVSASVDRTVKVWDLERGVEERMLAGHAHAVEAVAVTSDGRRAITGSFDRTMKVWNLESGAEERTLAGHAHAVRAIAVTADGRRVVSGSFDRTVKVWDLERGAEERTLAGHAHGVLTVAVTPDGRRAVSGSVDHTAKVWDLTSGAEHTPAGHAGEVAAVAVTADGCRAVSGSRDGAVKVWDLASGAEVRTLTGHAGEVLAVAVAPDGRRAVTGSRDGAVKVWDLAGGAEEHTLLGHTDPVVAVVVTSGGRGAVTGSQEGTVKVWDLESGAEEPSLASYAAGIAWAVALTPDGRRAVAGYGYGMVMLWDLVSGVKEHELPGHPIEPIRAVAVTPDGRRAVSSSSDGTVKLWNLASGTEERTLAGRGPLALAIAVTPDGRHAVTGSNDGSLKVWDLDRGSVLATFTADAPVSCCAVASDRMQLIAGDRLGRVHILVMEGHALT